jgi:hypothetical protein
MARLLAAAGETALRPAEDKDRHRPSTEPPAPEAPSKAPEAAEGEPAAAVRAGARPVHVAEPEPEPEAEQPATLEALAARFGQRHGKAAPAPPPAGGAAPARAAGDRSRQEREKQAAILARLREEAARSRP